MAWVDKVTTGTYSFGSFIVIVSAHAESVITQVDDHVKIRLTSQLVNGISRVLRKLLKYCIGIIISISFVLPSEGVFPVIFILDLNDPESVKL